MVRRVGNNRDEYTITVITSFCSVFSFFWVFSFFSFSTFISFAAINIIIEIIKSLNTNLYQFNSYYRKINSHATANPCPSQSYCDSSTAPTLTRTFLPSHYSTPHYDGMELSRPSNRALSSRDISPFLSFLYCWTYPSKAMKKIHSINLLQLHRLTKMGLLAPNVQFRILKPDKLQLLNLLIFP